MANRWRNVSFDYSGAAVLVTGGTNGIGASIAAAYLEAGAEVIITGTRGSPADYDTDLSSYRYLQLDVENREQIDAITAAIPKLDILINNAGFLLASEADEMEPDNFERAIRIHLLSCQRLAVNCKDKLAQSRLPGGASVIGIGSNASRFGINGIPGYGAAKTGLLGLTRSLAVEWGKANIRVNVVSAGTVDTRLCADYLANPEFTAHHTARTPLGRLGVTDDVNGVVLFLTSGAASWITGQALSVDGGYTIFG
jgi:NAD(P)-dependent dehydrogenase (short-subunit alcohol dehydrogenase family)